MEKPSHIDYLIPQAFILAHFRTSAKVFIVFIISIGISRTLNSGKEVDSCGPRKAPTKHRLLWVVSQIGLGLREHINPKKCPQKCSEIKMWSFDLTQIWSNQHLQIPHTPPRENFTWSIGQAVAFRWEEGTVSGSISLSCPPPHIRCFINDFILCRKFDYFPQLIHSGLSGLWWEAGA